MYCGFVDRDFISILDFGIQPFHHTVYGPFC